LAAVPESELGRLICRGVLPLLLKCLLVTHSRHGECWRQAAPNVRFASLADLHPDIAAVKG